MLGAEVSIQYVQSLYSISPISHNDGKKLRGCEPYAMLGSWAQIDVNPRIKQTNKQKKESIKFITFQLDSRNL